MYSDWGLHQVASYNLDSGSLTVMVDDLTRPAGVVVSHPDRVEGRKNTVKCPNLVIGGWNVKFIEMALSQFLDRRLQILGFNISTREYHSW